MSLNCSDYVGKRVAWHEVDNCTGLVVGYADFSEMPAWYICIYTKSQSSRSTSDFQQSQIKRLEKFVLQEISSKLLPKERVRYCLRHRITKDSGVKVFFNPVRDKAHYGNLVRCGSAVAVNCVV